MKIVNGIMSCLALALFFLVFPFCFAYFIVSSFMTEYPFSVTQFFIFYCLVIGIQVALRHSQTFSDNSLNAWLKKVFSDKK